MTDDPVARLKAGLDADEAWFSDRCSVDDPVGEDLRQRLLRTIAAHREILDKYEAAEAGCRKTQYNEDWPAVIIARDAWKQAVLALAAVYGDDDEANRG